jgi:SAM-dependent methyltransferase
MNARRVTRCGVCGWTSLTPILSLGTSPPPCVMHPTTQPPVVEERYPLELVRCERCSLIQLSVIVNPDVMFPPEFPYSSGNSRQLHRTFEHLARSAAVDPDDLIVDIGANDGTLLSKFDCRTVGVEPTRQVERIDGAAYQEFFTPELADRIREEHGPARVVTACNVMAHVEDPNAVMRGVHRLLAPGGVFIADNHDVDAVLAGQWDMVYHEHLRFYSPQTFETLLRRHGLGCAKWEPRDTHGGSFRMFATAAAHAAPPNRHLARGGWKGYADRVRQARREIRSEVGVWHGDIWGVGATARGTTILNYCGLDVEDVACVLEVASSDKLGHYIPGTRLPVVDEDRLFTSEAPPAAVLLLSWHLEDIIVPKLREKGYAGRVLVPLPEPHYAEGATPCTAGRQVRTTAITAAR